MFLSQQLLFKQWLNVKYTILASWNAAVEETDIDSVEFTFWLERHTYKKWMKINNGKDKLENTITHWKETEEK